ncbi:MAG TPA: pilus assembly protein TadG-related protein [Streptosporangiaceae bacterium]|nr:pilus assembly protein TadG-related protein [Streptosporangiaceae bacterium]
MRDLMLGLVRPMFRLLGRDDRGGVAVLIAVLMSGGVLLGLGALVVDVGQLYADRAQLQNGADSGALAVAKSCALGTCATSVAATFADANSATDTAAVNLVCGSGALSSCPASTGTMVDCPSAPASGTNYVDVHTSTLLPNGSTLVPPAFATSLLGHQNYKGSTVHACAQAEWGPPASANGFAVTISACEWDQATNDGTSFAPEPPATPSSSSDVVLKLNSSSNGGCSSEPQGSNDGPGVFGWTAEPDNDCTTGVVSDNYNSQSVSGGVPSTCESALAAAQLNKTIEFIPIYSSFSGSGFGANYTLAGFAAFVITGYNFPGFSASDWLNPANNCKGSTVCLNGYFTRGVMPIVGPLATSQEGGCMGNMGDATNDLGAIIIKLTG